MNTRWWMVMCGVVVFAACLMGSQSKPAANAASGDRWLADYRNDDGTTPDGQTAARDDSTALQKALDAGPGVVRIAPGTYQIHDVSIPSNVELIGSGPSSVLQAHERHPVFKQQGQSGWRLRDVSLKGTASGDWQKRTDQGAHGLVIDGSWDYEVSGVTIEDFDGAGIQIGHTNLQAAGYAAGGVLTRVTSKENHVGVRFDTRAEYITASHLHCHHNVTGMIVHAGNSNISNSNIGENIDGLVVVDHENGSHGSVTGCLINHNQRYALWANEAKNGMAITNCCFFYGTIKLEKSCGVTISSGLISASISTEGEEFNRISGNHIIPMQWQFAVSPSTICDGNYTKSGPWKP